jgi:tRNA pseudouridine38-40 synthase
MRAGAARFVGTHDFRAFMANPQREVESTVREITSFEITKRGGFVTFRVRGNGFLYKQVRSMVGMLIRIGHGQEAPETVTAWLDGRAERTARVPSAPPQGLTLWKVWY